MNINPAIVSWLERLDMRSPSIARTPETLGALSLFRGT